MTYKYNSSSIYRDNRLSYYYNHTMKLASGSSIYDKSRHTQRQRIYGGEALRIFLEHPDVANRMSRHVFDNAVIS